MLETPRAQEPTSSQSNGRKKPALPAVCFSHMHNLAGGPLHRHINSSNKSSALFRRKVEQQAEAGRNVLIPLQRSRDYTDDSFYHHKLSRHLVANFYVCVTAFSLWDIFVFFLFFSLLFVFKRHKLPTRSL